MNVLLLDMDGVLLEPHGYHRALQETVELVGRALGYAGVCVTADDIATLEAAGIANEWDSSAICAALLLDALWPAEPGVVLPTELAIAIDPPVHDVPPPDLPAFIHQMTQPHWEAVAPLERAERLLMQADRRTPAQVQALQDVLHQAHDVRRSLTNRTFQEFVLGSRVFAETYELPPRLDVESYLLQYDRPQLDLSSRKRLLQWLEGDHNRAVIFTNRPSQPPAGYPGTPEAEIGAQGLGLEMLPVVGMGGLAWLSNQYGTQLRAFTKPAPVHALAALRLALGDTLEEALTASARLALEDQGDDGWTALRDAQVYVFEDTVLGLRSVYAAQEVLARRQIPIDVHPIGVTEREAKRRALEGASATVVPNLTAALQHVPGLDDIQTRTSTDRF
jgi:hypothetical protein